MAEIALEEAPIRPQPQFNGSEAKERAWLSSTQEELTGYYTMLEEFIDLEPREIMVRLSAIAARLTTLRAMAQRTGSARANSLRTREIDPLIEACEFQFKIASRIQAITEMEARLSGGGV